MIWAGMEPENTEVEGELGLVVSDVDGRCKGQVDDRSCWEHEPLCSLRNSDNRQGSAVLRHMESGVLCNRSPRPSFPRPSPQGTHEALPSPILRRLASISQSRAVPLYSMLHAAPAGSQGGWAKKGFWIYTFTGTSWSLLVSL
jgi:hypothetical protein